MSRRATPSRGGVTAASSARVRSPGAPSPPRGRGRRRRRTGRSRCARASPAPADRPRRDRQAANPQQAPGPGAAYPRPPGRHGPQRAGRSRWPRPDLADRRARPPRTAARARRAGRIPYRRAACPGPRRAVLGDCRCRARLVQRFVQRPTQRQALFRFGPRHRRIGVRDAGAHRALRDRALPGIADMGPGTARQRYGQKRRRRTPHHVSFPFIRFRVSHRSFSLDSGPSDRGAARRGAPPR